MGIFDLLHSGVDRLSTLPLILDWRKSRFERQFATAPGYNLFRGVYATFEEAEKSVPLTRPTGYDNAGAANMYEERRKRIYSTDYPPLFWLSKLLASNPSSTVLDFGGHHGVSYYAYSRYLNYPDALRWVVSDLPAVVARGRELAAMEDKSGKLSFISSLTEAPPAEIFLASGSLQYLKQSLPELLREMPDLPQHVIVNMLPVHPTKSYFTVQEIGTAFCPYHIVAEPELLSDMRNAGYECVNSWENFEKKCTIAFEPDYSLDRYFGYYFRSIGTSS